jgi:hypothetical protein
MKPLNQKSKQVFAAGGGRLAFGGRGGVSPFLKSSCGNLWNSVDF